MIKKMLALFGVFLALPLMSGWAAEFVILVPFQEDIQRFEKHFPFVGKPHKVGDRAFYRMAVNGQSGYLAVSKAGLAETAFTCDVALLKLRAKRIISVGVAGSLTDSIQPGAVGMVSRVSTYEKGTYTSLHHLEPAAETPYVVKRDTWLEQFDRVVVQTSEQQSLDVQTDTTLTAGSAFIAHTARRAFLHQQFKADLVDMNAYSIAVSCTRLGIPYTIIRMVSDRADEGAKDAFRAFMDQGDQYDAFIACIAQSLSKANGASIR